MTRPARGAETELNDAPARRVVTRPPGVPGSRAVVGGLLVALAGVGTFVAWQQASGRPEHSYAVAARTLEPGEPITGDAVRFEPIDLPPGVAAGSFATASDLEGRVLVAPVGEGELIQRGALSDQGQPDPAAEVSVALARDLAVDGRVRTGDTVDVYATDGDATRQVAADVRVIAVSEAGGSFADGSELTVTLALAREEDRIPVIHAARAGEITLVRTTHVPRSTAAAADRADGAGSSPATAPTPTTAPPGASTAGAG